MSMEGTRRSDSSFCILIANIVSLGDILEQQFYLLPLNYHLIRKKAGGQCFSWSGCYLIGCR